MHIVALRLFDALHPRATSVDKQNLKADTAELGRSGQTQAVGTPERLLPVTVLVSARPSAPFAAARRTWKRSVPLSAENASVVPSGDTTAGGSHRAGW